MEKPKSNKLDNCETVPTLISTPKVKPKKKAATMQRRPLINKSKNNSGPEIVPLTAVNGSQTKCCKEEPSSSIFRQQRKSKFSLLNTSLFHLSIYVLAVFVVFNFVTSNTIYSYGPERSIGYDVQGSRIFSSSEPVLVNAQSLLVDRTMLLRQAGFGESPRALRNVEYSDEVQPINPNARYAPTVRTVPIKEKYLARQEHVKKKGQAIPEPIDEDENCEIQHDWQTKSFPTCNVLHEQDLYSIVRPHNEEMTYIASGGFRDVWKMRSFLDEPAALKTLAIDQKFSLFSHDFHRIDAVALARLSFSPYVTDVYAACVDSGVYEFGHGGTLQDMLFGDEPIKLSSRQRLILSYHVAASVADTHNSDIEGRAAISHTDIKPKQFIYVPETGILKLTDFNRAKFLAWNKKYDKTCPFTFGRNGGKYRAPEEYNYDPETEKIDVFQMGNTLYSILTGITVFDNKHTKDVEKLVADGGRPHVSSKFKESNDPAVKAMLKSLSMCWDQDPDKRATARSVERLFRAAMKELGLGKRIFLETD